MAYKKMNKNKKHQDEIRKANAHKKHERENRRNNRNVPVMTENDYLRMMRQQGLI
jgi:7-keto-8-aminopelargonate synthetase-like enzyme